MAGSGSDEELAHWQTLAKACQDEGADAFELNLSCPHMDRKDMGSNIGKDQELISIVTQVVKEVARVPVWAKLTPSTTDIVVEARGAFLGGADAIVSSNTFPSLPLIDPETLEFEMNVDGYVSSGGLGGPAILPQSLAKMAQLTQAFPDRAFSGIGGIADVRARAELLPARLRHGAGVHGGDARSRDRAERDQGAHRRGCSDFDASGTRLDVARGFPRLPPRSRRDALARSVGPKPRTTTAATTPKGYAPQKATRSASRVGRMSGSRPDFVELAEDVSAQPALEPRSRADAAGTADLVDLSHRRALDRDERGHHHLHARLRPDAAGHGVVAGDLTILLGNAIVLVPMMLNAHAGTKYGVSFPVLCRASFGVRGANVPAILRAIVACGWFGIQTWIGGLALHTLLTAAWPAGPGAGGVWIAFGMFWLVQVHHHARARGHQAARSLVGAASPRWRCSAAGWAIPRGGGLSRILSESTKLQTTHTPFWRLFPAALTANVGVTPPPPPPVGGNRSRLHYVAGRPAHRGPAPRPASRVGSVPSSVYRITAAAGAAETLEASVGDGR